MEVTPQTAALLLTRGDQPLAGLLQIGGKAEHVGALLHGMHGHAGLPGEIIQQPQLGGREGFVRRTRGQVERSDCRASIRERHLQEPG